MQDTLDERGCREECGAAQRMPHSMNAVKGVPYFKVFDRVLYRAGQRFAAIAESVIIR